MVSEIEEAVDKFAKEILNGISQKTAQTMSDRIQSRVTFCTRLNTLCLCTQKGVKQI